MRHSLRGRSRDVIAVTAMIVLGIVVGAVIVSQQRLRLPAWVPAVGTDFYTVEAELQTAQAVTPGQGQTVNVAGVPVGDVGNVELEDGRAVVEMRIRREHAPIYRDATVLLRPRTPFKDMYVALDPGTERSGKVPDGGRIAVERALPDVNLDEILAALDTDARDYLTVLVNAGGEALSDPAGAGTQSAQQDLRETFKRFEPTFRSGRRITRALASRRRSLRRVVHNFQLIATELGRTDAELVELVDNSNLTFDALAAEERRLRESVRLLPGALGQTETTLRRAGALASDLGPALEQLRPAARSLAPSLRELRPFLRESTPIIRDELRPFARDVRPTVRTLRPAAEDLAEATPRLERTLGFANDLLDRLAYNPPGSEEGYLFWTAWANHLGGSIFALQDAHGPMRRGLFLLSCPSLDVLDQLKATLPSLRTLVELLGAPPRTQVCTQGATP